ncbi:MAG: InlB B-repeat-containing protein [Spirochaetaceae bacterium]|jgi:uncharacterized repeat protein (TIGR02543 family)|nr:InlB B-repeat-containing protein [Spirochaetaceae bacterium]
MKRREITVIGDIFAALAIFGLGLTACGSPDGSPGGSPGGPQGNTWMVVYNKNASDAAGTMENSTFTVGTTGTLRPNAYTRNGHEFNGWASSSSGTAVYTDGQSVKDLAGAGQTITLYAVWRVPPLPNVSYTVVYDKNAPDAAGTMANSTFAVEADETLRPNAYTWEGYEFNGWALSDTGEVAYTDRQSVKNLAGVGQTVTLYAVWEALPSPDVSYTVIYNKNAPEAAGTMANSTFAVGADETLRPNAFTREGYEFNGWASSSSGAAVYTDGQSVKDLAGVGQTVTLYAVWEAPPPAEITVEGNTLADKLRWIQNNVVSGTIYFVNVVADESIGSQYLDYEDRNNITIQLKGIGGNEKIVGLSDNIYNDGLLFYIGSGVTLVLDDNLILLGKISNTSLVYVDSGGTFTMNGSKITGNTVSSSFVPSRGGGVHVAGTFTMSGGEISGNTASFSGSSRGGGVYVALGGTFTMSGGEISGNTTSVRGGGVIALGTFTMSGGEISGNTASSGGGVHVDGNGTFTMSDGEISGNTASSSSSYGGGVHVDGNGTFTMSGGEISGNTTASSNPRTSGGGVHVDGNGTFTMSGGEISGNTASDGGGVCVFDSGTFTMSDGEISGNTASFYGGGVCVSDRGTFTMSDGEISGNTASFGGGGVYYLGGTFTKTGGTITGYASDTVNGNVVKDSGIVQSNRGHAVYNPDGPDFYVQRRETTAGPEDDLDSSKSGAAGGWEL